MKENAALISVNSTLAKQIWYHGMLKRIEAENLLVKEGDFLVRDSISNKNGYVLTAMSDGSPKHFQINDEVVNDQLYYRFEEEQFTSVPALINFYQTHKRKVTTISNCCIITAVVSNKSLTIHPSSSFSSNCGEIEADYCKVGGIMQNCSSYNNDNYNGNYNNNNGGDLFRSYNKHLTKSETNLNNLVNSYNNKDNDFHSVSNIKILSMFDIKPVENTSYKMTAIKEQNDQNQDYCDMDYDSMLDFPSNVQIKSLPPHAAKHYTKQNSLDEHMGHRLSTASTMHSDDTTDTDFSNYNKNFSNSVTNLNPFLEKSDDVILNKARSFSNLRIIPLRNMATRPVSTFTSSSTDSSSSSAPIYNKHNSMGKLKCSSKSSLFNRSAAGIIAEKNFVPALPERSESKETLTQKRDSNPDLTRIENDLKRSMMSLNKLSSITTDRDSACVLDTSNEGDYDSLPMHKFGTHSPDSLLNNESEESEYELSCSGYKRLDDFGSRLISMNITTVCKLITQEDIKTLQLNDKEQNGLQLLLLPSCGVEVRRNCAYRINLLKQLVTESISRSNYPKLIISTWTSIASSLLKDFGNLFAFCSIFSSLKNEADKLDSLFEDSSVKLIKSLLLPIYDQILKNGEVGNDYCRDISLPYIQPLLDIFSGDSNCNVVTTLTIDQQLDEMWVWLSIGRRMSQSCKEYSAKAKTFYCSDSDSKHNIFENSEILYTLSELNQATQRQKIVQTTYKNAAMHNCEKGNCYRQNSDQCNNSHKQSKEDSQHFCQMPKNDLSYKTTIVTSL